MGSAPDQRSDVLGLGEVGPPAEGPLQQQSRPSLTPPERPPEQQLAIRGGKLKAWFRPVR